LNGRHKPPQHAAAARGDDITRAALEQVRGYLQGRYSAADERGEVGDVA
jgi:hypothetical protein